MRSIKVKRPNLFIKRFVGVVASLIILSVAFHLWFVNNARTVLKEYISEQSGGKIKFELSELDLNLFTKRLQIQEAELLSTDSLAENITYRVSFSKLSLKVSSVWALLFQKKLLLDSIKLYDPVIQVMQWRKDTAQVASKSDLSIPQEMGKFYNSMLDALNEFSVKRIIIENAKVSLINKMKFQAEPVTISNIYFDLARSSLTRGSDNIYVKHEQTVELKTTHQNIMMPGGRHRLSFKSFRLQLLRERIELDSCTVTAMATDTSKSNYRIFFKKLSLIGVDFAALSAQNIIKADSVYCENPMFDINLHRADANKKKTEIPDADKIIRELTGNLNLAYVGVKNAGIHFDIYGKTKRSFFNSNKDNFEIHNFRINPDAQQPVSISRFDMTLRDYNLFNEDSSSVYSFDSLHFLNSKIALNNFAISSTSGRNRLRSTVDIRVPYFELTELDWYQLIFDQNLVAKAAVLNNPVIYYSRKNTGRAGKKLNLFDALQNIDSLVALENLQVKNGEIDMKLGSATSFNVRNIDFSIRSNRLLRSTTKEGLRSAVEYLSFSNGVLRLKDITARLINARFTNENLIYADKVNISGLGNKIVAEVKNVNIDNLQLDDDAENIEVDGLGWQSAVIELKALPGGKKNNGSSIELKNIHGRNTQLNFLNGPNSVSTFVQTLNAATLLKKDNDAVHVEGFNISGSSILIKSKKATVSAASYYISSEASTLSNVQVEQINGRDSLIIQSSNVDFITNLNDVFANSLHLTKVNATAPNITISKYDFDDNASDTSGSIETPIRIDFLTASEPEINISTYKSDSLSSINIPRSKNSNVEASDIFIANNGLRIGHVLFVTSAATYKNASGELAGVENGKIEIDVSNIYIQKSEGKINWGGLANNVILENASGLGMRSGKSNFSFDKASLGNLNLSSETLGDFSKTMKGNLTAWLRIPQGQFIDSNSTFKWYNANYTNSSRSLTLDSIQYFPTKSLDSVLAHAPFQLDYLTAKTGAVSFDGLNVEQFEKDSSFMTKSINVRKPELTLYRDKLPPLSPLQEEKPLPAALLKSISAAIKIDSFHFADGNILYTEKSPTSRKQGTILLSDVHGIFNNIKNNNFSDDDSLSLKFYARLMDSAQLHVNVKQAYTDSADGLILQGTVGTADLSIFNDIVVPLSNVKIVSGILDSASFWFISRNNIALGEMNLHYTNLRIKLVKNGDPNHSTFMQNVLSFIANTFIIRSNNSKRTGVIYFKKLPKQSFVNFLVKSTLSGMASSVGAKKNKKYLKQYNQQTETKNLPPINL